jgi:DNA-binding CsgD family transcriptional regulator
MDEKVFQHIINSCDAVCTVCDNFFKLTGVTYFNFVRIYDDGARVSLYSDKKWAEFVLKNHNKYNFIFEEKTKPKQSSILMWDVIDGIREDKLTVIAREEYKHDHGITLINRYNNFTEFCYFAASPENQHVNLFYINNRDVLQQFVLYFKDKSAALIRQAENNKYYLPEHPLYWLKKATEQPDSAFQYKEFYKKFRINRFFLNGELKDVYLSKREAECLVYLFDGKSPKNIAKDLKISHRTVEYYIEQVKIKSHCGLKDELLKKLKQCGFQEIYDVIMSSKKIR